MTPSPRLSASVARVESLGLREPQLNAGRESVLVGKSLTLPAPVDLASPATK